MELVWDLIANAERRIKEGKFDDATARMYRATELGAQITLMKKGFDTGNLDTGKLPEGLRNKYEQRRGEEGKIKIGLMSDFELLKELGHPLGNKYEEIKNYLSSRNNSILAHGACPVTEKSCRNFLERIKEVYSIKDENLPEFPEIHIELFD
jgi:CRISPR-associated protein (TIGR02710 family)